MSITNQFDERNTKSKLKLKTFDISTIDNDFIYTIVDFFLDEICLEPSKNLTNSITNLTDVIMNFYLIAKKNGVIDVENSRKLLAVKLGKDPKYFSENIIEKCQELSEEFSNLEQILIKQINQSNSISVPESVGTQSSTDHASTTSTSNQTSTDTSTDTSNHQKKIPEIEEIIHNHENFVSEIIKKTNIINKFNSKNINKKQNLESNQIPLSDEVKQKIAELENKLREDIKEIEGRLNNNNSQPNIDTYMTKHISNHSDSSQTTTDNTSSHTTNTTNTTNTTDSTETTTSVSLNNKMDKLDLAFKKLYTRMNTPLVNLMIAIVIYKFFAYIFGI